jgi:hypothetical protein
MLNKIALLIVLLVTYSPCYGQTNYGQAHYGQVNYDQVKPVQLTTVGSACYSYLWWDIFFAELATESGKWLGIEEALSLTLTYQRQLDGIKIVESSIEGMIRHGLNDKKQARIWQKQLEAIFPDVKESDVITGSYDPQQQLTTFIYNNTKVLGVVTGKSFAQLFFQIWLNEEAEFTLERNKLVGIKKSDQSC